VLTLAPPLTISLDQLDEAFDILDAGFAAVG
jgi:4-aminobutyrate aminotransferase-like enzyme